MERGYFHHTNRFPLNFINTTTFVVCKSTILTSYDSFRNLDVRKVQKVSLTTWAENEIKIQWFAIYFMRYAEQHIRLFHNTISIICTKANTAFDKRWGILCRWWLGDDNNKIKRHCESCRGAILDKSMFWK